MQLQTFYTRTDRDERPVSETRDTFDLDFQHALPTAGRHQIVWGAGYRVTSGRIDATAPSEFVPARRTDNLYTGFVQDEITLAAGRMRLTLGSKFERNDYSGAEAQPGVRFLWTPDANRTFWAAATRAVRTPSRVETDYRTMSVVDPAVPVFVRLVPNPSFAPEKLTAYELGYRLRPASTIYLSFAGFYNRHRDILGTDILPAVAEPLPAPARVVIPVQFANGLEGHSYGGEVTGDARLAPWWRWTMNYSYVLIQLSRQPGSLDGSQERRNEGLSPRHQVQLHSSIDLPGRWSLDGFVRYISALRAGPVPAYAAANVRLAWQVTPAFEVSFVGQDLGGDPHDEWAGGSGTTIGIRRSGHVALTWRR
jgi:iron complex outermembrane receptor protein